MSPVFKAYAKQIKANAVAMGNYLINKGYKIVTDGTENHLVLWDLQPLGLTGNKVEKLCDLCNITVNKNGVFGDNNALATPSSFPFFSFLFLSSFSSLASSSFRLFFTTAVARSVEPHLMLPQHQWGPLPRARTR